MGSHKIPQQEMVEVDRSESASPFWRQRPSHNPNVSSKSKVYDSNAVVGASYSHADIIQFDDLALVSSRSRTPPSIPLLGRRRNINAPISLLSNPGHSNKLVQEGSPTSNSQQIDSWNVRSGEDASGGPFDYDVDADEDEFGLPSIANSRRSVGRAKHTGLGLLKDVQDTAQREDPAMNPKPIITRVRANSSDIAEERSALSYPIARKVEEKILRPQYKDILRDPVNSLHLIRHPPVPQAASAKEMEAYSSRISRINRFKRILQVNSVSLSDLRGSAWSGIPQEIRSISWQILLGYLPTSSERRVAVLDRKRREYREGIQQTFEKSESGPTMSIDEKAKTIHNRGRSRGLDENVWHQISIDVPRTSPHIELYGYEATQRSLERILYLWAIRHPASGYVQGINDLVTPFWQVFLGTYITNPDIESGMDPGQLPKSVLDAVEADSFWCLTKLLDGIQDNYIFAQPGIVRQVNSLRDLTTRIDVGLAKHLDKEGVEFMQFSFRWMNCLLMREVKIRCIIRMWDTYMSEEQGFSEFHLYVCAAFLVKWTDQLVKMDFQEIMMFLQALPTREWSEKDVELLLSEAYIWQSLFRGSSAHLKSSSGVSGAIA